MKKITAHLNFLSNDSAFSLKLEMKKDPSDRDEGVKHSVEMGMGQRKVVLQRTVRDGRVEMTSSGDGVEDVGLFIALWISQARNLDLNQVATDGESHVREIIEKFLAGSLVDEEEEEMEDVN